jgi:hypothetical protein
MRVEVDEQTGDITITMNDGTEPIITHRDPQLLLMFLIVNKLDETNLRLRAVMNRLIKEEDE